MDKTSPAGARLPAAGRPTPTADKAERSSKRITAGRGERRDGKVQSAGAEREDAARKT
jgi:hypothetical protein